MVRSHVHICVFAFEACGVCPTVPASNPPTAPHPIPTCVLIQEASIHPASPLWPPLPWDPVIQRWTRHTVSTQEKLVAKCGRKTHVQRIIAVCGKHQNRHIGKGGETEKPLIKHHVWTELRTKKPQRKLLMTFEVYLIFLFTAIQMAFFFFNKQR